ncbi:hypothetical protein [Amycolatopsis sp. NPDC051903]|uniref:hypothetical protein n=1 Tax=Amycolatopsis sp. NPDC051903 TaxID=3363936 RepID=UPI0037B202CE
MDGRGRCGSCSPGPSRRQSAAGSVAGRHQHRPARSPVAPDRDRETVIADKVYSHSSTREAMWQRWITLVSPQRNDQIARRTAAGSRGGRPPEFDPEVYKQRNLVERCFNRLNQFRDLATQRPTRCLLPRRTHHRRHHPVAPMNYWTPPSRSSKAQVPPTCR